jgi:hypothetical protein
MSALFPDPPSTRSTGRQASLLAPSASASVCARAVVREIACHLAEVLLAMVAYFLVFTARPMGMLSE